MPRSSLTPLALLFTLACGESPRSAPLEANSVPADLEVLATTLPLATFAERLLDGDPPVRWIVPAEERPDTWRPGRDDLAVLQRAAFVLTNGAGLEPWLDTVSLPASRLVDASAEFASSLVARQGLAHTHGLAGERSRPPADPYVWLDLELAARQVGALSAAFANRWPDRAAELERRAGTLRGDLEALDGRLAALGAEGAPLRLLAAAPVYAYLGRAHRWGLHALVLDPEQPPSEDEGARLESAIAGGAAPILLWPAPPAPPTARLLEERYGVRSIVFSPGLALSRAERERDVDFLDLFDAGVSAIEEALGR